MSYFCPNNAVQNWIKVKTFQVQVLKNAAGPNSFFALSSKGMFWSLKINSCRFSQRLFPASYRITISHYVDPIMHPYGSSRMAFNALESKLRARYLTSLLLQYGLRYAQPQLIWIWFFQMRWWVPRYTLF